MIISYNKREAKKTLVFTADELKEKIMDELVAHEVYDLASEDKTDEDLAADKRGTIEKLLEADREEEEAKEAGLG